MFIRRASYYKLFLLLFLSSTIESYSVFANTFWVEARGAGSCQRVCGNTNSQAIQSGTYARNGQPFFICSANARGEGFRAGYNLEPSWSNACIVGWGGKELPVHQYSCLCQ